MGRFGSTVNSLLETYARCLSLLKRDPASDEADAAHLRKSIRADRSRVRRAYSSQLSLRGGRLDQGDAVARHSVRKAIKRLTSAITRLLRISTAPTAHSGHTLLDYEALRSLSNASRIDTVRAIDELSIRVQKPRTKPRTKHRMSTSTQSSKTAVSSLQAARPKSRSRQARSASANAKKRNSSSTMASASTKLGEVRSRTSRDRISNPPDAQPTYPLRPYKSRSEGKGKRFWGLFG